MYFSEWTWVYSVNLWQARLLLYIAHTWVVLHLGCDWLSTWSAVAGATYEWICTVRDASSASQERHSSKYWFTEIDYHGKMLAQQDVILQFNMIIHCFYVGFFIFQSYYSPHLLAVKVRNFDKQQFSGACLTLGRGCSAWSPGHYDCHTISINHT